MAKKRKFSEDQLQQALSAIRQKKMKLRAASRTFKVPKSTLHDHLKEKLKGTKSGPSTNLTVAEETALVNYLLYMARQGFPLTRDMTRCFVRDIVKQSGRATTFNMTSGPSDGWFHRFGLRHKELSARKPENLDKKRASMSTRGTVDKYFNMLYSVLNESGVINKPSQIFNCDETGFSGKETPRAKVFGAKGQHVFRRKTSTNDHITAHLCISADGRFLPSFIIYQGSLPHRRYTDGIPDSWLFGYSESGYMDRDLFQKWFSNIFLPQCGRERPVVLVLDNHDSHISIPVIEAARENDIIIVGLPAHTTHFLQPLDVKIIGPLKERYCSLVASLGQISTCMVVGKAKFPLILKYSIDKTSPAAVAEAFSATGVCPFNPNAIDESQLLGTADQNDQFTESQASSSTCPSCGSFITYPLVKHGLIPQNLANILVPPQASNKSQKKNRRFVPEARVIIGGEMLRQLQEKDELEKKKLEDREKRKVEKEKKREEKQKLEEERKAKRLQLKEERIEKKRVQEEEKKERQQMKEQKKADKERQKKEQIIYKLKSKVSQAEIMAARQYVCYVCGEEGDVMDELNGVNWYGCDEETCGRWYHDGCLNKTDLEMVLESLNENEQWFCQTCKPWLYEEE